MGWTMTIEALSLEDQEARNPESAFPNDDISKCARKLMSIWGGLPEEFQEDAVEWTSVKLVVVFDVLSNINGFMDWFFMHCVPARFELLRDQ